jgi:ribosomal protein S18 acetylase RimI-like enzyme
MFRTLSTALNRLWPGLTDGKPIAAEPEGTLYPTKPPVRIRAATKRDYQQIRELYEELDVFHRQARPDLFDRAEAPPRARSTIFRLIRGDSTAILVAQGVRSGRLEGFVVLMIYELPASTVCRARCFVEIDKLAVREEARRGGIGRALLEQAILWAERRGLVCLEVAVNEFNIGAIALYEELGFETVLRRMMRKSTATSRKL